VTTEPAPTTQQSPTVTPGRIKAPKPIHTWFPILTLPAPRIAQWVRSAVFGAIWTWSPIDTRCGFTPSRVPFMRTLIPIVAPRRL